MCTLILHVQPVCQERESYMKYSSRNNPALPHCQVHGTTPRDLWDKNHMHRPSDRLIVSKNKSKYDLCSPFISIPHWSARGILREPLQINIIHSTSRPIFCLDCWKAFDYLGNSCLDLPTSMVVLSKELYCWINVAIIRCIPEKLWTCVLF